MNTLLSQKEIVARWGAHPTTGNTLVYSSIAAVQDYRTKSILADEVRALIKENPYKENGSKFEGSNACCFLPQDAYNEALQAVLKLIEAKE
jgi:hypothetical protein